MDNSERSDGVPRNFPDSSYSPGTYQTPLFSSHANHGNRQRLESRHVDLSPSCYFTSLPGDQNCTTNPTASQASVYQTPPLRLSSHFLPHGSRGGSADGFPLPPPQRAQPHIIPQHIPPHHPYTQPSSMTGAPTAYDFWGPYNNTVFYGSPMPPHYPYMPASEIGAPVAFDFPDHYNTLSYGLPILPHYPYTQASTTIGTSFPYYFPDCHDTVSYGPPMPPHYPYTQAAPTIGASLSYNFPGCQNTEVSRGSLGQYNLQSVQSFLQVQPVQGSRVDPTDLTQPLHVAPVPLHGGDIDASPKSKKSVRNLNCPASGCPSFRRPQDLRRHLSTHLPHWVNCPDPDCSWRGDRLSVFRKHWGTNHPSSSQVLDEDQFITYDPWPFVEKIKEGSLSIEDAKKQAMAMVNKKASELHKPELSENPWGRKRRRKAQKPG